MLPKWSNPRRKKFPEFQPFRPCEADESCEDPPEIPLQHVGSYKGELLLLGEVIQKSAALAVFHSCLSASVLDQDTAAPADGNNSQLWKKAHKRARTDAN